VQLEYRDLCQVANRQQAIGKMFKLIIIYEQ
jgi:hypothetical protein